MSDKFQAIVILMALLFEACGGNKICLNLKEQVIYSVDNIPITNLYLEENGGELIHIKRKSGKKVNAHFDLSKIDTLNYIYEKPSDIDEDYFLLTPNSIYHIDNSSIMDAAPGHLIIKTGEHGEIIYANIMCD